MTRVKGHIFRILDAATARQRSICCARSASRGRRRCQAWPAGWVRPPGARGDVTLRFNGVLGELLDVVTNLIPSGLTAHELMEPIANDRIVIEAICRDGKGILFRLDFP